MPSDAAWQAFDEARELFYAANLAYRATGEPFNAVPLLRRSTLLLLRSLALTAGVEATSREDVLTAVNAMEERDWVLRFPVLQELQRLDELDARFASLGVRASEEETRALRRLIEGMPSLLSSVSGHLRRHGVTGASLGRKRRIRRVIAVVALAGALLGLALFVKRTWKPAYQSLAYGGLQGAYFSDSSFGALQTTRTDRNLDFDWGSGSPTPAVPSDGFSVRWTGKLQIPAKGTYTFYVASDDGARLFIDDRLVVDNWGDHDYVETAGEVKLPASVVAIRVEYFDVTGRAAIRVSWSAAGRPKAVISPEFFVR